MRKVASVDNRSIFYRACAKFVSWFVSKIHCEVCRQMARVSREKKNCDNSDLLRTTHARLTQCSKLVRNRKKNHFSNLFVQISGRIWTVVSKGYFSHASSHSENVASARRVCFWLVDSNFPCCTTNQSHYPDLGSDTCTSSPQTELWCSYTFLRLHFVEKWVVETWDVCCFPRLFLLFLPHDLTWFYYLL